MHLEELYRFKVPNFITDFSLGCLVGPPFGSVLYSYCGMFAPPLISGGLAALSAVVAAFYLPQNLSCSTQIRSEQLTSSGRTKRINGLFSVENHPARTSVSSLQTPLIGGGIVEASEDLMTGKQPLFDPWAYFKFVAKPGLIVLSLLGSSSSYFLHFSFQDDIAKLRLNTTIHNLITFLEVMT